MALQHTFNNVQLKDKKARIQAYSEHSDQKKISSSQLTQHQVFDQNSLSLSTIKHSKNSSNIMNSGTSDQTIDQVSPQQQIPLSSNRQSLGQSYVKNSIVMPEFKIQFERNLIDHTPKSQYENFITELIDSEFIQDNNKKSRQKLPFQSSTTEEIKLSNFEQLKTQQINSQEGTTSQQQQIQSVHSQSSDQKKPISQQHFTPNKLTKFITNSLSKQVSSSNNKVSQKVAMAFAGKDSSLRSRSNSPYQSRPGREQHIPRIMGGDKSITSRSRSRNNNNVIDLSRNQSKISSKVPSSKFRSKTPNTPNLEPNQTSMQTTTSVNANVSGTSKQTQNSQQKTDRSPIPANQKQTTQQPAQQIPEKLQSSPQMRDEAFRQQFMQYLDILKEKVSEMELKVRESQNERNFYKQKYAESEEALAHYRELEKEQTVTLSGLTQQNILVSQKYSTKKKLLNSMQGTICSMSIQLEHARQEAQHFKVLYQKVASSQLNKSTEMSGGSPESILNKGSSRSNVIGRATSQQRTVEGGSPVKTPQISFPQLDFKQALNQKLLELRGESPRKESQENDLEDNEGLSQIIDFDEVGKMPMHTENQDLLSYLESDDSSDLMQRRKEKFRAFCRKYGVDTMLNLQQFFSNGKIITPTPKDFSLLSSIDPDIDAFIRFLAKKLYAEQCNRLKTEEQSAQVIEQLGKTIARLELKKKDSMQSQSKVLLPLVNGGGGALQRSKNSLTDDNQ